jgi:hypothetical protein
MEMKASVIGYIEKPAAAEMEHRLIREVEAHSIQALRVFDFSASISGVPFNLGNGLETD